jgi:uncharacterized protein (TIGR02145 family)
MGYRGYNGTFLDVGDLGYWWSSTEYGATSAWFRYLGCYYAEVGRSDYSKNYGFSVRCVRD